MNVSIFDDAGIFIKTGGAGKHFGIGISARGVPFEFDCLTVEKKNERRCCPLCNTKLEEDFTIYVTAGGKGKSSDIESYLKDKTVFDIHLYTYVPEHRKTMQAVLVGCVITSCNGTVPDETTKDDIAYLGISAKSIIDWHNSPF